jgi:hypothetical protein
VVGERDQCGTGRGGRGRGRQTGREKSEMMI